MYNNYFPVTYPQVQQMLSSGQITQEQFNRASQMANQMMKFMK